MLKTLAGLVAELREVGIPVSPTEHIDAAAALTHTAVQDRAAVKAALGATLVKNTEHWEAFSAVFDLFFTGRRGGPGFEEGFGDGFGDDGDGFGEGFGDGFGEGQGSGGGGGDGRGGGGGLGALSDAEIAEALYQTIRSGDRAMMRAIAAQLVTRHSEMEPGRRVAGVYYLIKALRAVDLDGILARLREERAGQGDAARTELHYASRADRFRGEVEAEIRQRLVADRGPEDVARVLRKPLPEDLDFLKAAGRDARIIRDALRPLARKLAARLSRRRRSHRNAPLDFRRTMRRALSTGGTPVELVFRRPHPGRPDLVVIADISGSVATFASFTLQLVHALRSEFAQVRSFVFIDGIMEITDLMAKAENIAEVTRQINTGPSAVWLGGGSNYGNALRTFQQRWGEQIRSRSTVLVLGDARNNYADPRAESLRAIAGRAKNLYWLNPEPRNQWNDGDSVIARYAPHCNGVFECRNIRQLKQFVERLE